MVTTYVVDASVILKWLAPDRESYLTQARQLFTQACNGDIHLVAPAFLKTEVSNVLLRKKHLTPTQINRFLFLVSRAHLIYIPESSEQLDLTLKLAYKYHLSVYDGLYLALAQSQHLTLISADECHHGSLKSCLLLKDLP